VLLSRAAHLGLVSAGLQILGVGCNLLPDRSAHVPRIGYISTIDAARDTNDAAFQALFVGLHDYGYVDGQNIQVDYRFPTDASQYSEIVNELLSLGVDVLLTEGTVTTQAAQSATSTVPIVGIYAGDPVRTGLVQSLARSGGNVTVISESPDDVAKRIELLHQIVPSDDRRMMSPSASSCCIRSSRRTTGLGSSI
jgi:putative ABC transport system substrate-binding protein